MLSPTDGNKQAENQKCRILWSNDCGEVRGKTIETHAAVLFSAIASVIRRNANSPDQGLFGEFCCRSQILVNLSPLLLLLFSDTSVKFQILNLSKFVSLACCCKTQAHSTTRGIRPKIIDVDLLSDVSSPKCHSPKSPRIKEEELDDIEEMQVEVEVEEDVMGLSDAESDKVEEPWG